MERHLSDELLDRLDALEAQLPALRAEYPDDGDLMDAFAGIADDIEALAERLDAGHDCDHCWLIFAARVDAMLEGIGVAAERKLPALAS